MTDCEACAHERSLSQAERLARIEEQIAAIRRDIAEMVCTQIKDHGKRIAALEKRAVWTAGWMAGAACASSGLTALLMRFIGG